MLYNAQPHIPSSFEGEFTTRRTKMNTTSARCDNGDLPILRFLADRKDITPIDIVDIGIGFPPVTTHRTAQIVGPRGRVIGVDTTIPEVVVEFPHEDGSRYAVFYDRAGHYDYDDAFALRIRSSRRETSTYSEVPKEQRGVILDQARGVIAELISRSGISNSGPADLERNGCRLSFQPLHHYTTDSPNLEFRRDGFNLKTVGNADVIRLGNVLLPGYYTSAESENALRLAGNKLNSDGIIIVARDGNQTITLKKDGDGVRPSRCTFMLQTGYICGGGDGMVPGLDPVLNAVKQATTQLPHFGDTVGQSMCRQAAEIIVERLAGLGYVATYSFGRHNWLDIAL